jgi:hypothetical protein
MSRRGRPCGTARQALHTGSEQARVGRATDRYRWRVASIPILCYAFSMLPGAFERGQQGALTGVRKPKEPESARLFNELDRPECRAMLGGGHARRRSEVAQSRSGPRRARAQADVEATALVAA